jgi:hypothetical protein
MLSCTTITLNPHVLIFIFSDIVFGRCIGSGRPTSIPVIVDLTYYERLTGCLVDPFNITLSVIHIKHAVSTPDNIHPQAAP